MLLGMDNGVDVDAVVVNGTLWLVGHGLLVDIGCWLVGGKLLGYLVGVDGGVGDELLLELVMGY